MIAGLEGSIERLFPTFVEINVNGVIYGVGISVNTSGNLKEKKDQKIKLFCTQIVREDAHLLFGFYEEIEKITFERLIKINGVGPKVALAILSTYTPNSFANIIQNKDISALQRVPGIGAKGAGKIMVELAGFFSEIIEHAQGKTSLSSELDEAQSALESLGFRGTDIAKALKQIPQIQSLEVSEIVKECLKLLGRGKV
ncbi:Holliday junction branch migration protein RuvA [Helicobacter sp. 23-1046]